jgi:heat shock protein HslJ
MDQETRFFQALGSAARWTIERGWPAADLFRRRG